MLNVCIVHGNLNNIGGSGRVALTVIEALKENGYNVTVVTIEPTNWDRLKQVMGNITMPDKEVNVFPFKVKYFGIYTRLMTGLKLAYLVKRGKCGLTINTQGDTMPIPVDINYMHYPSFAAVDDIDANVKYKKSLFWKTYFYPYKKIQFYLAKRVKDNVILTNSEYSRQAIKRYMGVDARIVYPPVDIDEFLKVSDNKNRENRVVACGRYTPEKRFEDVLMTAKQLPDIKFTIIGATSGKVTPGYYNKLVKMRKELGLDNVEMYRDLPRSKQVEIYGRSKVFMHPMRGEHFGIAVVEAMASGLIPVVYASGGDWTDILNRGEYGYGYNSLDEVPKLVLSAESMYNYFRHKVVDRARKFDKHVFKREFMAVVEEVKGG